MWACISELHRRGTADVLARARRLCYSRKVRERMMGADIIGQLGVPDRTFPHESFAILRDLMESEEDPEVLQSVGVALGHLGDVRAVDCLVLHTTHSDARVRDGVVAGLTGHDTDAARGALLALMDDPDEGVRDWATFAIALESDGDGDDIREALYRRLCDANEKVRHQATLGLARRKDKIVRKILSKELRRSTVAPLILEAAEELGDPKLEGTLKKLQNRNIEDPLILGLLERALISCTPD